MSGYSCVLGCATVLTLVSAVSADVLFDNTSGTPPIGEGAWLIGDPFNQDSDESFAMQVFLSSTGEFDITSISVGVQGATTSNEITSETIRVEVYEGSGVDGDGRPIPEIGRASCRERV